MGSNTRDAFERDMGDPGTPDAIAPQRPAVLLPPMNPLTRRLALWAIPVLKRVGVYGHNLYRPQLVHFWDSGSVVSTDPTDLLRALGHADRTAIDKLRAEFDQLWTELSARVPGARVSTYHGAASQPEALVLYSLVRMRRPDNVVETGVASGVSTFFVLSALEANQSGQLHSFDVDPKAGRLLRDTERERWHFIVLPRRQSRRAFQDEVGRLGPIDCFYHDSDHAYKHQTFEYRTVFPQMSKGGIFASDDVDWSFAFLDFAAETDIEPLYLICPRRVFGAGEIDRGHSEDGIIV